MENVVFNSSRILEAFYEDSELTIVFRKGGSYVYRDVDYGVWLGLCSAESPGKFFDKNIKSQFDYRKL